MIRTVKSIAENEGFVPLDSVHSLSYGDKVYKINRGKGIMLAVIGASRSKRALIWSELMSTPRGWTQSPTR